TVGEAHRRRERRIPGRQHYRSTTKVQVGGAAVDTGHHRVAGNQRWSRLRIELGDAPTQQRGGYRGEGPVRRAGCRMLHAAASTGEVRSDSFGPGFLRQLWVQPDHDVAEVV